MRRPTLALLFVLFLAAHAQAWSDAGHKIIASIAFRQLTPAQRERIVALLKHHPRYAQDFEGAVPAEVRSGAAELKDEWAFQQAAIWPDLVRGFPEAEKEKFHRGTWHYINRPLFLTDRDRERLQGSIAINLTLDPTQSAVQDLNVVQAIRLARRLAGDPAADKSERALMLTWIFHTVGDVHQPLHSTAMFAEGLFPEGDRGGNLIRTGQRSNLHSVWDGLPGGRMAVTEARNRALGLIAKPDRRSLGEAAGRQLDEVEWVAESHAACRDAVYCAEVLAFLRQLPRDGRRELPSLALSESYLKSAGAVAETRIVSAGYRLGTVLAQVADGDR
ncbi:S1/P1 nuclease [Planctellipticum variicoloris]|uniref:S1/P1 nuclease n=1 Tax=Planctellipticum variicoloris TaxID=3064265 RepID=UPI003013C6F4|nr:S1/P1 nuclease [Planctomycetaceae bacterium SH412]